MKYPLIYVILLIFLPVCHSAELVKLTSTDGRTISASIEHYSIEKQTVEIRVYGKGRTIPIQMDKLDDVSQKAVLDWSELNAILKFLTIRTERIASGGGGRTFSIELVSQSKVMIDDIRIEYFIPIKETYMEKEEDNSGSKKKKVKYNKISEPRVITGSIDVPVIKARGTEVVTTEEISVTADQSIDLGNDKVKEVTNHHSIKGILLKLYIGDNLLREYESQNGIKQLISKYDNG